jgi:hypothetical protein
VVRIRMQELWWKPAFSDASCQGNIPVVLNATIVKTCTNPNITYFTYHQQWCDNCCKTNTSLFSVNDTSSKYYYTSCDDYWYLSSISDTDMKSCWTGRANSSVSCSANPCLNPDGSAVSSEYCTRWNYYEKYCGKPFNQTLYTPIFVVEYLLSADPCGHCRSDESCPVWYGLECDECRDCNLLEDTNGQCSCADRFVDGKFETEVSIKFGVHCSHFNQIFFTKDLNINLLIVNRACLRRVPCM